MMDELERDRGIPQGVSIDKVIQRTVKQQKRKELHTTTHTTDIFIPLSSPVLFFHGIHLPDESDIGSLYLENHSGCRLFIYEGPGGGGRIIGISPSSSWRITSIADNITSISLVVDINSTLGEGLVIATLFSHKWAPNLGPVN